jgi:hypothetical protein
MKPTGDGGRETGELNPAALVLPSWARVSERRLAHITRVTTLLNRWAAD